MPSSTDTVPTELVWHQASGMLELAWHLFTWGEKIEVLAPPALQQALTEQLELALAHHRAATRFDVAAT